MPDDYDYAADLLGPQKPAAAPPAQGPTQYDYAADVLGQKTEPAATEKAPGYKTDVATDYGAATGRGLRRGIASGAGFPVDAGNALLGLVGLKSEHPVGGSDWWDKVLGLGIAGDYEGERSGARVAGRAAETVGSVVAPGGAATQAARQGYRAAGTAGRYLQPIVDAAGAAPVKSLVTQAGASVLPGTIAGATKELTGSDLLSSLAELGSFVGGPRAVAAAGKAGGDLIRPVLKPEKQARMDAAQRLRESASDPDSLDAKVKAAADYESPVEGYEPTTTERISDPGVSSLQQGVSATSTGNQFKTRQIDNNKAVRAALEEALPFLPAEHIDALMANVQQAKSELGSGAKAEDVGRVIRTELTRRIGEFEAARGEFANPAYERAREAAADHDAEITRLKALRDRYAAQMERADPESAAHQTASANAKATDEAIAYRDINTDGVLGPVRRALGEAKRPGDADGIKEIEGAFRHSISGEFDNSATGLMNTSKALAEISGDRNISRFARGIAGETKTRLDNLLREAVPNFGEERALYREGSEPINEIAGTNKAPTPAGEVLAEQPKPLDGYAMEQSKVIGQFFKKGSGKGQVEAARNLKQALADVDTRLGGEPSVTGKVEDIAGKPLAPGEPEMRPAALQAINDHVAELLGGYAKDGVLTADGLRRFHKDYGDALGEFPSVKEKVRNIETAQRTLETGQAKQELIKKFHSSINNAELTDELTNMISPVKLRKFVLDNREQIAQVAGPAQLQRLEMIAREMDQAYSVSRPAFATGSNTAEKTHVAKMAVRSVIGHIARVASLPILGAGAAYGATMHYGPGWSGIGGTIGSIAGGATAAAYAGQVAKVKDMSNAILGRALLNPSDAKLLLSEWNPSNNRRIASQLQPYWALAGTGDQFAREAQQ